MRRSDTSSTLQAEGIIQQVDTVNRELQVLVADTPVCFDVPLDCAVILNDERVKLRLLLPTDRVRITYAEAQGRRTARLVEV